MRAGVEWIAVVTPRIWLKWSAASVREPTVGRRPGPRIESVAAKWDRVEANGDEIIESVGLRRC